MLILVFFQIETYSAQKTVEKIHYPNSYDISPEQSSAYNRTLSK